METRKLKLEIVGADNKTRVTHHIFYEAEEDEKLHLSIGKGRFIFKPDGALIWEVDDGLG